MKKGGKKAKRIRMLTFDSICIQFAEERNQNKIHRRFQNFNAASTSFLSASSDADSRQDIVPVEYMRLIRHPNNEMRE